MKTFFSGVLVVWGLALIAAYFEKKLNRRVCDTAFQTEEKIKGQTYRLEVLCRKNEEPEIEILIPVHNGLPLIRLCVDCIRALTTVPYRIWIIDDKSNDETKQWLISQSDLNVIFIVDGTDPHHHPFKKWWNIPFGGSTSNGIALEIGRRYTLSNNVFVMHSDALPIRNDWVQTFLGKFDESIRGVSVRKDTIRVGAMHISGMLYDDDLFETHKMSFLHDMPTYDAGDHITTSLNAAGYNCHFFENTFNQSELSFALKESLKTSFEYSWLYDFPCDRAFDDHGNPFFLHLGRGTLQANTSKPRRISIEQWDQTIRANVLNKSHKKQEEVVGV